MKKTTVILAALMILFTIGCTEGHRGGYIDGTPLKDVYADNFLIGNIINSTYMSGDQKEILLFHYNAVTSENDMKPDALAPSSNGGDYKWQKADAQVDAMIAAGMEVHGHTLVWHEQTPSWMTSSNAEENMINYITEVMTHFKGKVKSWDVVNEAMKNDGLSKHQQDIFDYKKWKDFLRDTVDSDGNAASLWHQKIGDDYIYTAFKTARAVDPDAILYYNDYGLNGTFKPRAVYNMIKDINEQWQQDDDNKIKSRKLIEGIGMQGHYSSTWLTDTAISSIEANMRKFLELGIRVDISELDIEDREVKSADMGKTGKNTAMSQVEEKKQAVNYAKLFKLFLKLDKEFPNQITRITMWGIDDKSSWKSLGNPCLFDGNLKPKQAFYGVADPDSF